MKNKYYVNGVLVRTSDNDYNYAVMCGSALIACSGSLANAEKRLRIEQYYLNKNIEYHKKIVAGLVDTPKWYESRERFIEVYKSDLERCENRLSKLKIVKLDKVSA